MDNNEQKIVNIAKVFEQIEQARYCGRLINMASSIVAISVATGDTEMAIKYSNKLTALCDDLTKVLE